MTAHQGLRTPRCKRFFSLPKTRLGWWTVGLAAAFVLYLFGLTIGVSALEAENLPGIGPSMFGVTLAAGATGLMAVLRRGERSILVLAPALIVVSFLLAEVLIPH